MVFDILKSDLNKTPGHPSTGLSYAHLHQAFSGISPDAPCRRSVHLSKQHHEHRQQLPRLSSTESQHSFIVTVNASLLSSWCTHTEGAFDCWRQGLGCRLLLRHCNNNTSVNGKLANQYRYHTSIGACENRTWNESVSTILVSIPV